MKRLHVPRRGCATCPYRRDTPAGIWHEDEYRKLRDYDDPVASGAIAKVFHCHQENATQVPTVCRGWLQTHRDSVPVRLAVMRGALRPADVPEDDDPDYYTSGAEACDAGLAGVEDPCDDARRAVAKLIKRGAGRLLEDRT